MSDKKHKQKLHIVLKGLPPYDPSQPLPPEKTKKDQMTETSPCTVQANLETTLDDAVLEKIRHEICCFKDPVLRVQEIKGTDPQVTQIDMLNTYWSQMHRNDPEWAFCTTEGKRKGLFQNEMLRAQMLIRKRTIPQRYYSRPASRQGHNTSKLLTFPIKQEFIPPTQKTLTTQRTVVEPAIKKAPCQKRPASRPMSRCNERRNSFMLGFKSLINGRRQRNTSTDFCNKGQKQNVPWKNTSYVSLSLAKKTMIVREKKVNTNKPAAIKEILTRRRMKSLVVQKAIIGGY